jgi:hypothetical protein
MVAGARRSVAPKLLTAAPVATPSITSRGFWTGRLACGELRMAHELNGRR